MYYTAYFLPDCKLLGSPFPVLRELPRRYDLDAVRLASCGIAIVELLHLRMVVFRISASGFGVWILDYGLRVLGALGFL